MDVLSKNDGLLTNIEVLELLQERQIRRQNSNSRVQLSLQSRDSCELQTLRYLSSINHTGVTSTLVADAMRRIKALDLSLTEGEMVQIANLFPIREVEIHVAIEECAERLTEEQIQDIITIIKEVYGIVDE